MSKTIELPDGTPHTFTDEELERGEAMMADECDSVHMHKVARRIREALGEAGE